MKLSYHTGSGDRLARILVCLLSLAVFSASAAEPFAENGSYDTLCAEMDNINIPIVCTNLSSYRVVATNPRYNPTSINEWGADFSDCTFGDDSTLWLLGSNNGSAGEFRTSGFSLGDVYYAPDNPAAGLDEAVSNLPREINNNWMYDQYIQFTADEDSDANIEAQIGAVLTLDFAQVSGTLEIKVLTQSTNGWVDQGSRVFNSGSLWGAWDLPDHVWMEGVDTNVIHLQVIRAGDGGQTTTNAWGYYDQLSLVRRGGRGSNANTPAVLYSGSNTIVEAVWIDFWWRNPREMKINVIGGSTINTSQYLRIKRRMPNSSNWNEIFVLYEDGNARIIPFPPTNLGAVPYGASVILGPTTNCPRPAIGIDEVTVDPDDLSLDIKYQGGGTAHVELRAHRDGHIVDVSQITYDTVTNSVVRFRSMWVHDGKADIDRIQSQDGIYPIMDNWTNLQGSWWQFFKEVPSYHNTYCPDFRMELMDTNFAFLIREAESADDGSNYVLQTTRTNAGAGQTFLMSTNGGELVYNVNLSEARPDAYLYVRYADTNAGDGIDKFGNTIRVIVDDVRTAETFSVNTGGWDEFEYAPSLALGDLDAGSHEIRVTVGGGTDGVELDRLQFVSQPSRGRIKKSLVTKQGEAFNSATNATLAYRAGAVGGQAMHLEHTNAIPELRFNATFPSTLSNVYLRVRYSDDVGPNKVQIYIDGGLRGKFPSEDTGVWSDYADSPVFFLGTITSGVHEVRFVSTLETWGVDIDEFEIYALYDNRPPVLNLDALHVLPVGSETSFVAVATDVDGNTVTVTNPQRPASATFVSDTFWWQAGAADECTTNAVLFVANDGMDLTNSIVTNLVQILVPEDYDGDGLRDGWEWSSFVTLTNEPTGDVDGDGADNLSEYIAGTDATNTDSSFSSDALTGEAESNHLVVVPTAPGRRYTVYFSDSDLTNGLTWQPFANTNNGYGTWLETNTICTTHTFTDDEGVDSTGGAPADGRRYYRVRVVAPGP
ncbi:MAG TPA: carbohydrate-binding protein [Kiritimatiellia bacterium]|mgnify:CR=1 FL=1|nr:carbohydrate-binding protein [Kiritimatiellia bacterium]